MAGTELAKAYVQIIPSADGIKGKLSSVLGGEASSAGKSAGKTVGASLGSSIKKTIAAAGISTAVAKAFKSALSEGADLQQSLGGIETLFKDSANKVIANAKNAYMTAGLSANEYMESITSFSASLLQGLAGDTNKAADVADMALTDMSDNANKMGTSMELIQNAYQGFAKQNYTMLDNLKLGYGGTKTEMQRLLVDAQKLTGVKYDMDNLSDVYEAIHIIQEEMGITGTTADEAAGTFSGSLASMKAAVGNLLGNLSLGENIKPAMDALISSIGTFLIDNLFPMVRNILSGLVDYIVDIVVNTDWILVITQILTKIKDALETGIETFFGADASAFSGIFDALINNIPVIAQTIQDAFTMIWEACNTIWTSIGQPVWDAIMVAIQYVADNWGSISESVKTGFQTVCDFWKTIWSTIGQPIWDMFSIAIESVAELFAKHMPAILNFFQEAITGIRDTWENHLKPVFEAIGAFLNNYIKPAFEYVWKNFIVPLIENVFSLIGDLWNNTLKPIFDAICDFITGVFTLNWQKMKDSIFSIITALWNGIKSIFNAIKNTISTIWNNISDDVTRVWDNIKNTINNKITLVKNTVSTVFDSIKNGIATKIEAAKDAIKNAIDKIKSFFNFSWSLPKLKMPHFSIKGSFSLNPLSVPSFGIDWYAKAMNDPMIMNSPTAFGINSIGQIMAGGERGSEVISGTDTLMKMIASAVAQQNREVVAVLLRILETIVNMDENMGENMREGLSGMSWKSNNRELARFVRTVTGC